MWRMCNYEDEIRTLVSRQRSGAARGGHVVTVGIHATRLHNTYDSLICVAALRLGASTWKYESERPPSKMTLKRRRRRTWIWMWMMRMRMRGAKLTTSRLAPAVAQ